MSELAHVLPLSRDLGLLCSRREAEHASPLRPVNPRDVAGWDDLVMSHPNHCFFWGNAWSRVLQDSYGYQPIYLLASDRRQLRALLPVMEVQSPFTGRRGVSLPFTDECPIAASDSLQASTLFEALTEMGRQRRWRYWECRGTEPLPGRYPIFRQYFSHRLDLSLGEDQILAGFKSPVRTAIRKAEQAGVRIEATRTWDAVKTFYDLHCLTRRKHGLPPQPLRFFRNIYRHVLTSNLGLVLLARHQGRPVAGAVYFCLGRKAMYKFGASDPAFQELRANNLVMWQAIQWFARSGCESLHFGRTDPEDAGLRRYKLGWGAGEETISYLRYDYEKGSYVAAGERPAGWPNRLMAWFPTWLLRMAGEVLYRHVA